MLSRRGSTGSAIAKWCALVLLLLALPLFVRAGNQITKEAVRPQATPQPEVQTEAPTAEPTPTPTPTPAPTLLTPQEVIVGITFSDATAPPPGSTPGASPSLAPATPASTPSPTAPPPTATPTLPPPTEKPTDPPGVWTYDNGHIVVRIEQKQQDDFVYFAVDIQLTRPQQFAYAFSNEKYGAHTEALSDIAARHNPLIAINGDYYGFHNNGIIIRGGELFRKSKSSRALMIVEANGDLTMMRDRKEKQSVVAERLMAQGVLHTYEFGPVLVEDGAPVELQSAIVRVADGYLEPRTAIGQYGPLHYLVIVVDGRSEGYSAGCDLPTLQQLFVDYGVTSAFNLDGGGSTTLWYDGEVINRPSSGDERKVSDIVMFMRE